MNRQDLFDYRNNKKWYLERIEELKEREIILGKLTALYGEERVSNGSRKVNDKIADNLAKLMDKTSEYYNKLNELDIKNLKVINILEQMKNTTYRNLLYDKYIKGIELKEITEDPNYKFKDYKYACNIHGYALKEFDKICINFSKVE